jgi:glucokinase
MASASTYPRLVGDVGGTNARFARIQTEGAPPTDVVVFTCADYATLEDAIAHYLSTTPPPRPRHAAIGIATAVTGDRVQMTNHHWGFSIAAVQQLLGLERLLVLNDFTALALSLPALTPADVLQVGGGAPVAGTPVALLGAGTGLGVSGLVWPAGQGNPVPLDGEGGHVTLPAHDDAEALIVARLRERFGHASAERALSGPGLENLHEALGHASGTRVEPLSAAGIGRRGLEGSDALCVQTIELFFALLGSVAGDLALTLGARGGVYVAGGIVPRLGPWIERSRFRERFQDKGRFAAYLAEVPTYVVTATVWPALIGASRALDSL